MDLQEQGKQQCARPLAKSSPSDLAQSRYDSPQCFMRYPDGFLFIELGGTSILSKWYSESSKNLSLLFECIFSLAENECRFIILLMGILLVMIISA